MEAAAETGQHLVADRCGAGADLLEDLRTRAQPGPGLQLCEAQRLDAGAQLNPNNPYAADGREAGIWYNFGDINSSNRNFAQSVRAAGGLTGEFALGGGDYRYDIAVSAMQTNLERTVDGALYFPNLMAAIRQGTYNFVNPDLNTDAVRQFIAPQSVQRSDSKLVQVQANVARDLFTLPGGVAEGGITADQLATALMKNVLGSIVSGTANALGKVGATSGASAVEKTKEAAKKAGESIKNAVMSNARSKIVFGGLTLLLQDELFIKMKPTIVNVLFASLLLGGLAFGQTFIKIAFGEVFHLTDEGWRVLTVRWALFFLVLAILNEIVWRYFSTDFWISFKVWGVMPLTMAFAIAQISIVRRYEAAPKA